MGFWGWLDKIFGPPPPKPPPPRRYTIGIHAFSDADLADEHRLAGALVIWDGAEPGNELCDDFGRCWLPPLPQQGFNITVKKDGYSEAWVGVILTRDWDLNFVLTALVPPTPSTPPATAHRVGPVRANHHVYVDDGVAA